MKKNYIIGIILAVIICMCALTTIVIFKVTAPVREAKKIANGIKNNATVFINDGITDKDIEEIRKILDNMDGVTILEYISKEEALNDAKKKMGESADLLDSYTEKNHPFKASFKIDIDEKKIDFYECISKIEQIKNVYDVKYYEQREKLYLRVLNEGAENFK